MSGSLSSQQSYADSLYGFPAGTMAALAQSESSGGTNMGTLGNIYQVTPSTAANPGYGLGTIYGNDPVSVGSYLSALQNSTSGANCQGSLTCALSAYQAWGSNGGPNTAMQSYLTANGLPSSGSMTVTPAASAGGITAPEPSAASATPSTWLGKIASFLGGYASRGALILLAIILLIGAAILFAERTQITNTN